jgi:hypothetical protein
MYQWEMVQEGKVVWGKWGSMGCQDRSGGYHFHKLVVSCSTLLMEGLMVLLGLKGLMVLLGLKGLMVLLGL